MTKMDTLLEFVRWRFPGVEISDYQPGIRADAHGHSTLPKVFFICPDCGDSTSLTYRARVESLRCSKCAVQAGLSRRVKNGWKPVENRKFSTAFVKNVFVERGAEPTFDVYTGPNQELSFLCQPGTCGNPGSITWRNLYYKDPRSKSAALPRCKQCIREMRIAFGKSVDPNTLLRQRHFTETVSSLFRKHGADPLFSHYEGLHSPLRFRCATCENEREVTLTAVLDSVRKNPEHQIRCKSCITSEVRPGPSILEMETRVRAYLAEHGATPLFESYPGQTSAPIPFRCACGNEHAITWGSMRNQGVVPHCVDCREAARPRGDTHPNWNPEITDEQRAKWNTIRSGWQMQKWYADIKILAGYTCALSGRGGQLASHHIAWVHRHEDKMFDLDNGVCLLATLHDLFHKLYGWRNAATPDEVAAWEEFRQRFQAGAFEGQY